MTRAAAWAALVLAGTACAAPAVVHRLARDNPPQREMAAVVPAEAAAPAVLAARLAEAGAHTEFAAGTQLMLLATGPLLDQPDQARALGWQRDGTRLDLTVEHSRVRAAGQLLERNLGWRPLLQAPLPESLPPGDYTVSVHWLSPGAPRRPELSQTLTLRLRPRTP